MRERTEGEKQRERTEQGIERRVEKNRRMDKIDCRKEHRKRQEEQIKTDFKFQNEVIEKEDKNSDVEQLSAQSTRFVLGRIPQETKVKNRKNRKNGPR